MVPPVDVLRPRLEKLFYETGPAMYDEAYSPPLTLFTAKTHVVIAEGMKILDGADLTCRGVLRLLPHPRSPSQTPAALFFC